MKIHRGNSDIIQISYIKKFNLQFSHVELRIFLHRSNKLESKENEQRDSKFADLSPHN